MLLIVFLMLVLGIPAGGVWLARALGLYRAYWQGGVAAVASGLAPAVIVFVGSRQSDSITNAAGYYMAPFFAVIGIIVALIAAAIMGPR